MNERKHSQAPNLRTFFGVHQTMQCDGKVDILGNTSPADEVEAEATITACIMSGLLELVGRGLSHLHLLKCQYAWSRSRRCPWRSYRPELTGPLCSVAQKQVGYLGGSARTCSQAWFFVASQSGPNGRTICLVTTHLCVVHTHQLDNCTFNAS